MHDTIIKMKDGREFCNPVYKVDLDHDAFEDCTIQLFGGDPLRIGDMASAITKGERISISKIGDHDLIAYHKKWWERERELKLKQKGEKE